MAYSEQSTENKWPSDPKHYQWKGTLSVDKGTWKVLAHCKPLKKDVFLKIKQTQDDDSDIDKFTENTKNLINIQHKNLLTPVHAFVHKSEIWVVYPRHSGGPVKEALSSHYPNGIPVESVVASILYDVACGLHNLHKQQQCHRNIRAESVHVDIDCGISLLSEFGELKEIKWKNQERLNTLVTPDREPFTDPLIIYGDENVSWYAGDIYAFGITALQLTYGSPPPLNIKNILHKQPMTITTDLYDKKCPFSNSFEKLIKDCCAAGKQRISVNKLLEHKFFRSKADPLAIKQYFGHILKSTEKRIVSSLANPMTFTQQQTNGYSEQQQMENNNNNVNMGNNENINDSNNNNKNKLQNGLRIIEPNGNHINMNMNGNDINNDNNNNNNTSNEWSFSTTMKKSDIDLKLTEAIQNGNTPILNEDQSTDNNNQQHRPRMHQMPASSFNDPSSQHQHTLQPKANHSTSDEKIEVPQSGGKKLRNYHVSFSESESVSHDQPDQTVNDQTVNDLGGDNQTNGNHQTVQINRFKVEFGSRLSESQSIPTHIEPSHTNDEDYDPEEYPPNNDSDDDQANNDQNDGVDSQNSANNEQTTQIKRFLITRAKPDNSADEQEDNVQQQQQQQQQQQPPQQQQSQQQQMQLSPNQPNVNKQRQQQSPPQQQAQQVQKLQQPQQPQQSQQPQQPQQAQQLQQQTNNVVVTNNNNNNINNNNNNNNVEPEYQPPSKDKVKWTAKECSDWLGSLGGQYKQYMEAFVENGIDGEFLGELDHETLKEIITSGLHRKKILSAWSKLQQ